MPNAKNEAKIRFTAETEEFTAGISAANSEMSTLRAEMKLAEATFKNTGDSAEYMSTRHEILQKELEANSEKQEALTGKLEKAKEIYGEDSEEVAKLERQLISAQTEEQRLKAQLDDTNGGLEQQEQAAQDAGASVDSMAEILVNADIAGKIKEIADAAIDLAKEFDEASAAVVEGTGASGEALEGLNQSARNAFGSIADSNADLNSVSNTLAELNTRFGSTGQEAEDLTVKMENFAHHTGTSGVSAVDSIADIMHRWGLDMDDVDGLLDDLTTANQSCQLSVDQLTGYLSSNSTQFQELGYSTEEALAMIIGLSDGGANVSTVMSGLTKGIANMAAETNDVPGAFRSAVDAIADCDNVSEALQAQVGDTGKTVEQIFGKKAAQELATNIQNGSFAVEDWTKVLQDNDGALQSTTDNATTMSDAWSQATNNITLALGSTFAPVISDVTKKVADVLTTAAKFVQGSPGAQAMIVGIATALGILGAALGISAAITAVTKAFTLLNTAMLANPVFLFVTALAALAAGLIYAWNNCESFRETVTAAFEAVRTFVVTAITVMSAQVKEIFDKIKNTVTNVSTAIKTKVSAVWNGIKSATTAAWNGVKNGVTNAINGARNTVTSVTGTIKSKVLTAWNGIKTTTSNVWNGVKSTIGDKLSSAKDAVATKMDGIKDKFKSVSDTIKSTVGDKFGAIKEAMTSKIESARDKIKSVMDKIKGFFPLKIGRIFTGLKLPKISVSGGSAPFGIGGKGSLPHFSVTWNKLGAIFKKPTIFTTPTGLQGVGEAGAEAVAPIDTLQDFMDNAVRNNVPQIDYDRFANKVARACAAMNVTMQIDHREVGRVVRSVI